MAARLHIDFETKSAADIKATGALKYAEHPSTEVTRLAWQFEGRDVQLWKPGRPFPNEVLEHVAAGSIVVAHNAGFERRIWNLSLSRQVPGLPIMRAEQQSCTLARALVIGLPRDLKTLARVLGCRNQKMDVDGRLFKKAITAGAAPLTPDEEALFDRYNLLDVLCEAEVDAMLPELSQKERQIWLLDQRINDRGIPIDLPSVVAMQQVADEAIKEANREIRELTRGAVQRVTEAARLERYLKGRGFDPDGVSEFELGLIDWSEDPAAQKAVELRTAFGKSSIKKLGKMLGCVAADGRLHDQYGYSVAGTRRWAGQIVQFQNLPRYDEEKDKFRLDTLYALLERFGCDPSQVSASLRLVTAEPLLDTVSAGIRKLIKAGPGNSLVGGDLKNIEGRVLAWLAGQDDKLEAFRAFDAGRGPDLYRVAYAKAFGVTTESVDKQQRFLGKLQELACGYQGGVGAFLRFAENAGMNLVEVSTAVRKAVDPAAWRDVSTTYRNAFDKHELPEDIWPGIKILVRNFRAANDKIARSWYAYMNAALAAIERPGELIQVKNVRGVSYLYDREVLWCGLPSGGLLGYWQPEITEERRDSILWPDGLIEDADSYLPHEIEEFVSLGLAELIKGKLRRGIKFMGKAQQGWASKKLYAGLLAENCTQSVSRDIQCEKMLAVEEAGFAIICHTHDDIVSEIAASRGDRPRFAQIMSAPVNWAPGLPIAADCWEGIRYGG